MKVFFSVLVTVTIACVIAGCDSEVASSISMTRQQKYSRVAIVCAPIGEANPSYSSMILKEAQTRIYPLQFLEKVDCLPNVSIDTTSTPPVAQMDDFSDYDAVVSLVYSYGSGHVCLECYMTDTVTGEQIWYHKFDSPDPSIKKRLCSQGLYTPAIIKKGFYGL